MDVFENKCKFSCQKNIFYTDWKPENMGLGPLNPTLRFINKKRDEIQNEDSEGDHVYNVVISKKVNNQEVSSLVNAFSDNASANFQLLDNEKTLTIKESEQQRSTDFATGKYENFQTPSQYFNFTGSSEATFHGFKMPRKGQELDYSDMFFKFVMSRNEEASTVNIYDFFKFVMTHDERARIRRNVNLLATKKPRQAKGGNSISKILNVSPPAFCFLIRLCNVTTLSYKCTSAAV